MANTVADQNGDDEFLESFKVEALELLTAAESDLLKVEAGQNLTEVYDSVFRALHSVKGGSGIFGLNEIQSQVHQAETCFCEYKGKDKIDDDKLRFLLEVVGKTISYLEGKEILDRVTAVQPTIPLPVFQNANKLVAADAVARTPTAEKIAQKFVAVCVDDEPEILEVIVEALEEIGMQVYSFEDPHLALTKIDQIKPDVIVSDVTMPGMTGLDLLKVVKGFKSDYPVLFCSGAFDRNALIEAINNGAEGVIEKPIDHEIFVNAAMSAAKKSRLTKMMNQTINLLMYQYPDFDDYLRAAGKEDVRKVLEGEMSSLVEQRNMLRQLKKRK